MKFRKIYLMIIFSIVIHFFSSTKGISQERGDGELIFNVSGLGDNSETYVTVTPKSGKTRWRDDDGFSPWIFIPCPDYFSSAVTDTGTGDGQIEYYEAPDDPGNDNKCIPYGIYTIQIWNPTHSFDETFDLDLRTADWETGSGYQEDLYIEVYFDEDPIYVGYHISYLGDPEDVDLDEPYYNNIWDWFPEAGDQNKTDLKVPITYGTSHYGLEFVVDDDTSYYYPTTTSNYGWTESETFKYISPQSRWGYNYAFTQWKGGGTGSTKNITVDDEHDSYEAIAQYTQTIPTPTGFTVGTRDDHPYLTWNAVIGDSMGGYNVWRSYDHEAWELRTTINDDETDYFLDIEIEYDPGGDPVSYKIQTKDVNGDTSLCTSADGTKGNLLTDEPNPSGAADLSSVEFSLKSNVPNPFNPFTSIGYSLAVKSDVVLSIYNVLGKKIRTLVSGEKSMGEHSSIWDGTDDYGRPVSAGVYIYTIQANPISNEDGKPFRSSGKMLLSK